MNKHKTLKELLQEGQCPVDCAKELETTVQDVAFMMQALTLENWGKEGLYVHIISRKRIDAMWPARNLIIIQWAKRMHDAGSLSLCQKVEGEFVIQYAIPTQATVKREPWFTRSPEIY